MGGLFNEGGGIQYMVPYFQRQYTWTKKDWQILLEDVLLLCNEKNDDDAMEHFMGSVVIVSSGCAGSAPGSSSCSPHSSCHSCGRDGNG